MADAIVGSYWPMRGEPDLRAWIEQRADHGRRSALPSIVEKAAPLVYRPWRPGDKLVRGVWSIPEPVDGPEIVPDIVLAPVVGFDDACYRLGYGGGYFDRTLAKLSPRPLAIGVGYELAAMPSIRPLPHDIPMDVIITERRTISKISPARSSRA
jgi:5,10-methenyltetrahydrofolate synthetase